MGTPITHRERERRRQDALIFNLIANKRNWMPLTTTTPLEQRNCSQLVDYLDLFILHLHLMGIESFPFWENLRFFGVFRRFFSAFLVYFPCFFSEIFFVFPEIFLFFILFILFYLGIFLGIFKDFSLRFFSVLDVGGDDVDWGGHLRTRRTLLMETRRTSLSFSSLNSAKNRINKLKMLSENRILRTRRTPRTKHHWGYQTCFLVFFVLENRKQFWKTLPKQAHNI